MLLPIQAKLGIAALAIGGSLFGGWAARGRWDAGKIERLENELEGCRRSAAICSRNLDAMEARNEQLNEALRIQNEAVAELRKQAEEANKRADKEMAAARQEISDLMAQIMAPDTSTDCCDLIMESWRRELLLVETP